MKKIRVLIAEDHHVVREGLVSILNRAGDMTVVAEAKDGAEAVAQFKTTRPDVAMLDLEMPQLSGLEAIRQIREHDPQARIVVLTTYAGDERIHRALEAGASAYVLKDARTEVVLEALRDGQRRRRFRRYRGRCRTARSTRSPAEHCRSVNSRCCA